MKVGTLEIDLMANMARLQADMNSAKSAVGGAMADINRMIGVAQKGLVLLVGIGSVAAFGGIILGAIESAAKLHDLAIQTGATVESLSAMGAIGKLSDTSLESITGAMGKLSKGMAGTTEESKGVGLALQAMGIDFDTFKKMDPDAQMMLVAKSMDGFASGSGKAAVAMALYGKEGAKMLPFLGDLATTGDLVAKVTAEQAAQADNFADNLTKLSASGSAWKKQLALGILPAMDLGLQAFLDVMNGAGGLKAEIKRLAEDGTLASWTKSGITGLTYLSDAVQYVVRAVKIAGEGIGAYAAAGVAYFGGVAAALKQVMAGDFGGAVESMKAGMATSKSIVGSLGESMNATFGEVTVGAKIRARMSEIEATGKVAEAIKPKLDFVNVMDKNAKAAKAAKDPTENLFKIIGERMAQLKAQGASEDKLTDTQQFAVKVLADMANGHTKLTEAQKVQVKGLLNLLIATERTTLAHLAYVKSQHDAAEENYKAALAYEKTVDALGDQDKAAREALLLAGLTEAQQLALNKSRTDALILTKEQELATARADSAEAGFMSRREIGLAEEIRLLQNRNDLEGSMAALKAEKDTFRTVWESVDRTAHDVFVNIFEGGQNAFAKLTNVLKSTLLDLLYQMTVKKWLFNITAAVTGTGSSVAQAATGMGGEGGGAMGGLSSLSNLYSAVSSMATVGTQVFAGTMSLANALGTIGANATGTGISGLLAANGAYGTAAAGSASGLAGGAMGVLGAIPGWGWAAMAAIAVASIFGGRGKKETTGGGIEGSVGQNGFQGNTFSTWKQDGGWFRSDRSGKETGALDASTTQKMSDTFAMIRNQSASAAQALGLVVADVLGFSQAFSVQLGSDNAANEKAVLAMFQGIGNNIASAVAPGIQNFSRAGETTGQTLIRLGSSLSVVNGVFSMLSQTLLAPSLTSGSIASSLIDAFGGLEKMSGAVDKYYTNFYTEEEKRLQIIKAINAATAGSGLDAATATRASFRATVEAQNLGTESGQRMYAALLTVSEAFAGIVTPLAGISEVMKKLTGDSAALRISLMRAQGNTFGADQAQKAIDTSGFTAAELALYEYNAALRAQVTATEAAQQALVDRKSQLVEAYRQEAAAMQSTVDRFRAFATDLRNFRDSLLLGSLSPLTPDQKYAQASKQFDAISAATETGTPEQRAAAMAQLQGAATALLEASKAVNASGAGFIMDFDRVQEALSRAALSAGATADVAQLQLNVANAQLAALGVLNDTTRSVDAAIRAFLTAQAVASGLGISPVAPAYVAVVPSSQLRGDGPVVSELVLLREEVAKLRSQQDGETRAVITSNNTAAGQLGVDITTGLSKAAFLKAPVIA